MFQALLGTLVNTGTVILGSIIGMLLQKGLPERFSKTIMSGLALCTIYIGISGMSSGQNALITIISMVVGALLGVLFRLDDGLEAFAGKLESKFQKEGGGPSIAQGFITASLVFCVGSMTIVGALQSGLSGDHSTLYAKSALDFVSAIIFASSLGLGVLLSAGFVLVFQGAIALLAGWAAPVLQAGNTIAEMVCVGSLLLVGLGLNMLGLTKLKVMNYLPAIFIPILLCRFL